MRNSINDDDSFYCRVLKHLPVDSYVDLEDSEEEDEEDEGSNSEMLCPYCSEGFDALGLCVHLEDQHPFEIKLGVCPLCATNLGKNMISHLIIQHERVLKDLCKKLHIDESLYVMSLLRKRLQEKSRTLQKESASVTSTNFAADPLLFSFVYSAPQSHEPPSDPSAEPSSSKTLPQNAILESTSDGDIRASFSASEDHEDKAQKSDLIQTILLSTIFTDNL